MVRRNWYQRRRPEKKCKNKRRNTGFEQNENWVVKRVFLVGVKRRTKECV